MAIHHTQRTKASKIGVTLTETEDGSVRAFNPMRAIEVIRGNAKDAIELITEQMQQFDDRQRDAVTQFDPAAIALEDKMAERPELYPIKVEGAPFFNEIANLPTPPARSSAGIALDGAIAYGEGTLTADCPFDVESDDEEEVARANAWYEAWDAAADAKEEEEEKPTGSVVDERYRARYAEAGDPTGCGDWLDVLLKSLTKEKHINIELFEEIVEHNGLSVAHLNRTNRGWQGRLRMTGRNMLARQVFNKGGIALMERLGRGEWIVPPAEWVAAAATKYKKTAPAQK